MSNAEPKKKRKLTALEQDKVQRGEGSTAADYVELSYEDVVQCARQEYAEGSDDDVEIDDEPKTSRGARGCWVQA